MARLPNGRPRKPTAGADLAGRVQRLLAELLCEISDNHHHGRDSPPADQACDAVLDTELNGDRYLLWRMPAARSEVNGKASLSRREEQIAMLVAEALPDKAIARRLNISPATVGTHLSRMFLKLGVKTRTEVAVRLLAGGRNE
jgi:DNA-binding NarL/FixJ family response regulator